MGYLSSKNLSSTLHIPRDLLALVKPYLVKYEGKVCEVLRSDWSYWQSIFLVTYRIFAENLPEINRVIKGIVSVYYDMPKEER